MKYTHIMNVSVNVILVLNMYLIHKSTDTDNVYSSKFNSEQLKFKLMSK